LDFPGALHPKYQLSNVFNIGFNVRSTGFATNELLCDSQSDQNQISRRRLKCFISIRRIIWMVASDSEFWDIIDNCDWASIIRVK